MKHILNNLTEVEKNAIREQHSGGMKVNTEKFNLMVEKKLGDVKQYLSEQIRQADPMEDESIGINEIMDLAYEFMNNNCPEGPKDKMKYMECIGRLQDLFGMTIKNLKGNISDSSEMN
jgi:hypothetical protein